MRVAQALAAAHALGVERLDAQLLLAHLFDRPRSWLIAHDDENLDDRQVAWLQAQWERRAAGEPLAYLIGEREFCGLRLHVTPDVLVPRPETEMLVEWAEACLADRRAERADALSAPAAALVDLGTGSGAIALALRHRLPEVAVTASDANAAALQVARDNGERLGLAVEWLQGDWWAPLARRRFDLAVSNPPYIAGDDIHLAALSHEPRGALTPEGDGLSALRAIVRDAPAHLLPGAWLLLEHGHDQGAAVAKLLRDASFSDVQTRADLAGLARCSGGRTRC